MPLRRILAAAGLLAAAAGPLLPATPSPQSGRRCSLQPEHAAIIVMQSPAAVKTKASGGCPAADYTEKAPGVASFQLRNLCARSSGAVLGNYSVDMSSGRLFEESGTRPLDSPALRTTTAYACSMSVRGVLPSLLPRARPVRGKPAAAPRAAAARPPVAKK